MSAPTRRGRGWRRQAQPKSAREIALNVLYHVDTRRAFADLQLGKALRDATLEPRDAAFATELVMGTLRLRTRLDWILAHYVRAGLDSLNPWMLNVLRLGLHQILHLDVPPHAAVDTSVVLARKYGHAGTAGLVNAVLRKVLQDGERRPDPDGLDPSDPENLAIMGSHPEWLVERWLRRLGPEETRALMAANNRPAALGLRVNALRTDRETLRKALVDQGIGVEATRYSKTGLRVEGNLAPMRLPEFQDGLFFVQDESETLVGELVAPEPGETVLDLCAAPGGKTAHLQEQRNNQGRVIAVDVQRSRLGRLQENVERLGLNGVEIVCADGGELKLNAPVDRVLVDAPCSGLGVLGRRADARWRKTDRSFRDLIPLEAGLLRAGAGHVKPGGVLVYSVCSTEPEEGFTQVSRFLAENPGWEQEDAAGFLPGDVVTEGCLLVYPHRHGTDGAFAARLRRSG